MWNCFVTVLKSYHLSFFVTLYLYVIIIVWRLLFEIRFKKVRQSNDRIHAELRCKDGGSEWRDNCYRCLVLLAAAKPPKCQAEVKVSNSLQNLCISISIPDYISTLLFLPKQPSE